MGIIKVETVGNVTTYYHDNKCFVCNQEKKEYKNMKPCTCCGQLMPYPTEPGKWEFKRAGEEKWIKVTIRLPKDGEGLLIYKGKSKEPMWWPDTCEWRQIK